MEIGINKNLGEPMSKTKDLREKCNHDFTKCPLRTKEHPMGFTECPDEVKRKREREYREYRDSARNRYLGRDSE